MFLSHSCFFIFFKIFYSHLLHVEWIFGFLHSIFWKVVANLDIEQKKIISKYDFQNILPVSRFKVPDCFLEWLMSHTCPLSSEIIVGGNHITITKSMVTKVLGIPQGSEPVVTQSKCKEVTDAVNRIKEKYVERKQYPISKCEELMKNDHDEVSFMRSFMMLLISTILAPGKDNCCSIEYLYSLVDISKIQSYDWAGMILDKVMSEVKRYHNNVNSSDPQKRNMKFYYEGFLPLLAVSTMTLFFFQVSFVFLFLYHIHYITSFLSLFFSR